MINCLQKRKRSHLDMQISSSISGFRSLAQIGTMTYSSNAKSTKFVIGQIVYILQPARCYSHGQGRSSKTCTTIIVIIEMHDSFGMEGIHLNCFSFSSFEPGELRTQGLTFFSNVILFLPTSQWFVAWVNT